MKDKENLYQYLLLLGDSAMILGHRLSELCGHGPSLETDIACTNISLDLFGEVRNYFQYAATLGIGGQTEDEIAYFRDQRVFRNPILCEMPNQDFAHVIVRQFLYDVYHHLLLEKLQQSNDPQIAAIASKSVKEARYHLHFSSAWIKRLGDGTPISQIKIQNALDTLYPFCHELLKDTDVEICAAEEGYGVKPSSLKVAYFAKVNSVLSEATLQVVNQEPRFAKGKLGMHTEYLGAILADFQFIQRAYPNLTW